MAEKKQALTPEEINQQREKEHRDPQEMPLVYATGATPVDTAGTAVRADASTANADVVRGAPMLRAR